MAKTCLSRYFKGETEQVPSRLPAIVINDATISPMRENGPLTRLHRMANLVNVRKSPIAGVIVASDWAQMLNNCKARNSFIHALLFYSFYSGARFLISCKTQQSCSGSLKSFRSRRILYFLETTYFRRTSLFWRLVPAVLFKEGKQNKLQWHAIERSASNLTTEKKSGAMTRIT